MNRPSLLIAGAGGHARACLDVIEHLGAFAVAGFTGLAEEVGREVQGIPVLGTDEQLGALRHRCTHALVGVGQVGSPDLRIELFTRLRLAGYTLSVILAPTGYVARSAVIGAGSIVMPGAVVNAGAKIGENCIVNSHALVEHDAVIEDHCHVSTGAIVNGGARIGRGTFIGSGSVIREGITLGNRCVIGMGARVRHHVHANTRAWGDL